MPVPFDPYAAARDRGSAKRLALLTQRKAELLAAITAAGLNMPKVMELEDQLETVKIAIDQEIRLGG